MPDCFERAVQFIFRWEGGYSNDPEDRGGETNYGISERAHPEINAATITEEEAKNIYRKDYWRACRCSDMPWPINLCVFDGAVNHGPHTSVRLLQTALKVDDDGKVGPITLKAVDKSDTRELVRNYIAERARLYHRLAKNDDSQEKFIRGWYRRIADLAWEAAL